MKAKARLVRPAHIGIALAQGPGARRRTGSINHHGYILPVQEIEVHFADENMTASPILDDQRRSPISGKAGIVGLAVVSATGGESQ